MECGVTDRLPLPASVTPSSPDVQWLVDCLDSPAAHMDDIQQEDSNVVFYVAGFIGRGISRANRCASCKTLLLEDREIDLDYEEYLVREKAGQLKDTTMRELFNLVDRGGLAAPTEFTYAICIFAYSLFNQIMHNADIKKRFLACNDHSAVFVKTVTVMIADKQSNAYLKCLMSVTCKEKHAVFRGILQKLFNCFIKNVLKKINSELVTARSSSTTSTSKKIRKLTGKNSANK